jgi:hypothetical protein
MAHRSVPYRDPQIPDGERTTYRLALAADTDATEVISVVTHDGDDKYVLSMSVPHPDLSMTVEQVFARRDGTVTPLSYLAEARSAGKLVSREEGYFDGTSHIQFGGKVRPYPRDMIPLLGGILALRGIDFAKGATLRFNLWLAFSVFWQLDLKVERQERITVPAGSGDAWRVKVRPSFAQINGLLDKIIGGLLPDFTVHFEAAPPHRMMRFSFPTGPFPWNPKGIVEATALT